MIDVKTRSKKKMSVLHSRLHKTTNAFKGQLKKYLDDI